MTEKRPSPDEILRQIQACEMDEECKKSLGKLKIFLGLAAGVGKTYRMLERAIEDKEAGVDVVIGVVETHGRAETEALIKGFEAVPKKLTEYGGLTLFEMDLDAILQRKPRLVMVDELAHTNTPGSKHNKRYQDVTELLEAGIDVYTTLNVQHIESFNDIVFEVTGVRVRETVPDQILELAHHPDGIEVVDLPPDELIERMEEGKVYVPEKSAQAVKKFFRKGNLLALREMALRYTARLVDEDIRTYMSKNAIQGPWSASPRLLVCVSPSPSSEKLIRLAKQLAPGINAEWFAVYVEPKTQIDLTEEAQAQLDKNLELAEELGGNTSVLVGDSIAEEVLDFARDNNITIILVGWNPKQRLRFFKNTLVDSIVAASGNIHVMVVTDYEFDEGRKRSFWANPLTFRLMPIIMATLFVTLGTVICILLRPHLEFVDIAMLMLVPVLGNAIFLGRVAGIFSSLLAVLSLDFFFVLPYHSFTVVELKFLPAFFVFFLVGIVSSLLAETLRMQSKSAKQRALFVNALYNLSRELLEESTQEGITNRILRQISSMFKSEAVLFLAKDGLISIADKTFADEPTEHDLAVAQWCFGHGQPAGKGTETLSSSKFLFAPIKTNTSKVGALGLRPKDGKPLGQDQRRLLDSFTYIIAVSLERFLK